MDSAVSHDTRTSKIPPIAPLLSMIAFSILFIYLFLENVIPKLPTFKDTLPFGRTTGYTITYTLNHALTEPSSTSEI
jgi:hypothetical protein